MSERETCHWWLADKLQWVVLSLSGYMAEGYCPKCGTALHVDGTETVRVDAVTSEALRETTIYRMLEGASYNLPQGSVSDVELGALCALDLVEFADRYAAVSLTDAGRTVLAALQQAAPPDGINWRAVAEWLAKQIGRAPAPELWVLAGMTTVGTAPPDPTDTLDELQQQVGEWVHRNFGDAPLLDQAAVVCEEAGELIHHVLKAKQGIRREEDHTAGMRDAVADVVIACLAFGALADISVAQVVRDTWAEVSKRDWTANAIIKEADHGDATE